MLLSIFYPCVAADVVLTHSLAQSSSLSSIYIERDTKGKEFRRWCSSNNNNNTSLSSCFDLYSFLIIFVSSPCSFDLHFGFLGPFIQQRVLWWWLPCLWASIVPFGLSLLSVCQCSSCPCLICATGTGLTNNTGSDVKLVPMCCCRLCLWVY